ncbi:MAG: C10 family peptidase, partial [Muribaculaceae bacterium]
NYFEWPKTAKGSSSYVCSLNGSNVTLSLNFSDISFDWDNMLDEYDSSATDEQKEAVATLMYSVGVGALMNYGMESGAYISEAYKALISYFDYDKSLIYTHRYYYSPSEWNDLVYNEVANGRPVLYTGYNSSAGHAFVCDGYSSDNFFHINWGWSGMSDGYFKLSALNPDGQGIGGSDAGYNANQEILYGFAPNNGTAEYYYSVGYDGDFTCSATDVAASDVASTYINFSTGKTIYQYFAANQSGITDLGVDAVNDITNQSTFISCDKFNCDLCENYYYKGFNTQASNFANLGDGSYTIYPAFSNEALGVSGRVLVPFGRQKAVKLTVNGGALSFSPFDIEQPVITIHEIAPEANLYANKPYKINFKSTCTGTDFLDDLYVVLYDADNEAVYSASNQFEILNGETVSDAIIGELSDVEAGNYTLAICTLSNDEYRAMASIQVAVGECSDDYNLTNNGFVFPSILNIYSREFETDCKVANTGGLFGGVFYAFIYSNTGVCVAQLASEYCIIDKDVTKLVHFSGSFDATPGKVYSILLFLYDEVAGWIQIGNSTRFTVKGLTGIDEVAADAQGGVAVYPNPATEVVCVESPSAMGAIKVLSIGGQEVISTNAVGSQRASLQMENLPSGVYILKITTDDGIAVRRIVKK